MSAFFSKVFARGKEKGKDGLKEPSSPTTKQAKRASRASAHSLLEGKFEAVSPSVSPTVERYEDKDRNVKKDKEKEKVGLFRPKSRPTSAGDASRKQEDVPQLKLDLNLPSIKDGAKRRNLSIVYEGDTVLDDAVLGEKRLGPAEALKLMRACSSVLTSRGLETLGVMHPHWHSASPAAQRRIISLFLSSLAAPSSEPSAASASFESELEYAPSPYDVAAVFRWALRHLKLEGAAFDKDDSSSLVWYDKFTEKEKSAEYPKNAYSNLLLPTVKPSHAELLETTLTLVSRLASHSEWNGTSGSKLSMCFGHYLLTGNLVDNPGDWLQFYSQWEGAGRALEHIFLSSLRDEEAKTGIPKRLSELVVNYPYAKSSDEVHFPRPTRFATRPYDALYVLVTSEISHGSGQRDEVHPLQIVSNALKSDVVEISENREVFALWEEIRKVNSAPNVDATAEDKPEKFLSNLFSDESIRMLSLRSNESEKTTPTISMFAPVPEHESLFSIPTANGRAKVSNGSKSVSRQTSEATASSPIASDWNVFTSAGFGESAAGQSLAATLLDSDLERTEPPPLVPHRSLKKKTRADRAAPAGSPVDTSVRFKTSRVSLVKIDETFIDFWSDSLLDRISGAWPNFVVCQLKSDAARTYGDRKVAWLVIEQKFVEPAQAPPPSPPQPARRASSPRPSIRSDDTRSGIASRVSVTFSPRKRFNFFGSSQTSVPSTVSGAEKKEARGVAKGTKVNELGEVIPEEKNVDSSRTPRVEEAKALETKVEPAATETKEEGPKEENAKIDETAAGVSAVAVGTGALAVASDAAAKAFAPEENKTETPAQVEVDEAKEQGKEHVPEVPPKDDAEAELDKQEPEPQYESAGTPSPPPVSETKTEEQPAASPAEEKPAEEAPILEPPVVETAAPAPESEVPTAATPTPEAPPAHDESSALAAEETAPEEPKVEEHPTSIEVPPPQTEETLLDAHQVPNDSRFVEHIESSPETEQPEAERLDTALGAVAEQDEGGQQEGEYAAAAEPPAEAATEAQPEPAGEPKHTTEEPGEVTPAIEKSPVEPEATPEQIDVPSVPVVEETSEGEVTEKAAEEHETVAPPVAPSVEEIAEVTVTSEKQIEEPTLEEPVKADASEAVTGESEATSKTEGAAS